MGNAFRNQPAPTLYGENKTAVTDDLLEVGLLVAFGMIAFSFILIIPGIRGWERLWAVLRVGIALWIGAIILVGNFSYGWQADTVYVHTQYKAFTDEEIEAEVGLHVGLRGVNITLKANPTSGVLAGEEIDYNNQYWWAEPWAQGRIGFGIYAGRFNREFRASQYRGDPYPILWVAEYFTLDGEQIRWGRKYRLAGWYTHICLWICFAVYLIAILLFIFVIRQGAIFTIILGTLMIMACFAFGVILYNAPPLVLPWSRAGCTGDNCTVFMVPRFHWSWYLTLFTGIFTFILGFFILFMDFFFPRLIAPVFHHSLVEDDEIFTGGDDDEGLEYGEAAQPVRRGGTGRTRRGLTRLRQTQRKSRRSASGGGSMRLKDEIPLEAIQTEPKEPTKDEQAQL